MNVHKIVLTGGPCAGKTKVLNGVTKKLREDGYYVITVPETAASLIGGNIRPYKDILVKFQEQILDIQKSKEDNAIKYAEELSKILEKDEIIDEDLKEFSKCKGIIVIFDRGLLDNRAYLSHEEYNDLIKRKKLNELSRLDNYDMVIDLISMANLKKDAYQNSEVRFENPEEAEKLDINTSGAWLIYDDLITVKPKDTMEEKIDCVYQLINNFVKNNVKPKKVQEEVDIDYKLFEYLDDDNSRVLRTKKIDIDFDKDLILELYKIIYGDNIDITKLYLTKEDNNILSKEKISFEDYCCLLGNFPERKAEEKTITRFIDSGNVYSIINDGNSYILETYKDNIEDIPQAITLKKKGK